MNPATPKVILVSGASSGIGESLVLELLGQGHRVHGAARRLDKMGHIEKAGATIHFLDLADDASITKLVGDVLTKEDRIDVLVNNAGCGVYGAVEDTPLEEARHQFEVNLFGLARLTQLALPSMRARRSGMVINLSSIGGRIYTPLGAWYHASKHALEGWSDCLRVELLEFGIRVVLIEPGAIQTEFHEALADPFLNRSGTGPYSGLAQRMAAATARTFSGGRASPPSLVAKVIAGAIKAKRPRTRYVVGHLARPLIWLRRVVSDRLFDRIIHTFT